VEKKQGALGQKSRGKEHRGEDGGTGVGSDIEIRKKYNDLPDPTIGPGCHGSRQEKLIEKEHATRRKKKEWGKRANKVL